MKAIHLLLIVLMTGGLASCGGSQAQQQLQQGPSVVLAVSPSSAEMDQGATQQFAAMVTGTANTAVTWSVQEANGGSINAAGLYTAPALAGTFHVIATSQADPSKSAAATVVVVAVSITVNPSSTTLDQGATQPFTATVTGSTNTAVTWSVQEAGGGSVTAAGLYTAPNTAGTFHVVATSQADASKSAVAIVTVATALARTLTAIAITPSPTVIITQGATLHFAASASFSDGTLDANFTESCSWVSSNTDAITIGASSGVATALSSASLGATSEISCSAAIPSGTPIVFSNFAVATVGTAAGSFDGTGSALAVRSWATATRLADGRVLVAGGADFSGSALAAAELYLPGSGTFEFTDDLITARVSHTATLLSNGKVLIAGGIGNGDPNTLAGAELYDPSTETFTPAGDMTVARSDHTATLLADGRVLIVGGGGGNEATGSAELYDPVTGIFAPTGVALWDVDHAYGHTATRLPNGKVLIAGGVTSSDFALGTAELYDPAAGTFTPTGGLTEFRYYHTATLLNDGRLLIVGGSSRGFVQASAEVYDPATGAFTPAGSMAQKRWLSTANLLASGRVLVAGGSVPGSCGISDECGPPTNTAELYDPVAGTFAPAASMAQSRAGHTATLLTDGAVLVVGGRNDSSAELFRE